MKMKLCVLAMALLGANVWAAGETASKPQAAAPVTKDTLLAELNKGCIDAGNNSKACDCSINSFKKDITDEEWNLLVNPPKKVSSEDLTQFQEINKKVLKAVEDCGATQTKK